MNRWTAGLVGLALAGPAALAVAGTAAIPGFARERLAARGCTAGAVTRSGLHLDALDLACPGLTATALRWDPLRREARLDGVVLDLSARTAAPGAPGPAGPLPGGRLAGTLWVDGLEVRAGGLVLARDLAGRLLPLDLVSPGMSVRAEGGIARLALERELAGPLVQGRVRASAAWDGAHLEGTVGADPTVAVAWPLLGPAPLPGLALRATVRGRLADRLELEGTAGWPGVEVRWTLGRDAQGTVVVEAVLPDTDLGAVLDPLAPLAPEVDRARIRGTLGGRLAWRSDGPPSAVLRLDGVEVEGALPPEPDLEGGRFTWPCRDAAGRDVRCASGEGTPGWTPLARVPPALVHAVLAAEDAAFFGHRGYDPAALQEALDADLAVGRVVRGGSTLTQQLAKNLFLDGEQTLVRKVREFLLAVELDRTLGKERVLELYLNVAEWGPGLHGIDAACERYLLKEPARVDPLEAAFLAALLPSPRTGYRRWYLEGRPDRERLAGILDAMVRAGWLHPDEAAVWAAAPLRLVPPPDQPPKNSRM